MKAVYLIMFALVFTACRKSAVAPNRDELIGTWNWVAQHIGAPQNTQTPQTTGIQEQLAFGSDNRWFLVQNNVMVKSGTYHLVYSKNDRGENINTIHYEDNNTNSTTTGYYAIRNDTLSFDNGLMGIIGGGLRIYAR